MSTNSGSLNDQFYARPDPDHHRTSASYGMTVPNSVANGSPMATATPIGNHGIGVSENPFNGLQAQQQHLPYVFPPSGMMTPSNSGTANLLNSVNDQGDSLFQSAFSTPHNSLDLRGMATPHSRKYRQSGITICSANGSPLGDLTQSLEHVENELAMLKKHASKQDITIERLEGLIQGLSLRLNEPVEPATPDATANKSGGTRREQNTALINAVHGAAKALLGARETRVEGEDRPVLTLPHPLGDNEPTRLDPEGHKLWNPKWLEVTPLKNSYNESFIKAVVAMVISNARAPHPTFELADTVLNQPKEITDATKQYFRTLVRNYKAQNDIAEAKKNEQRRVEQARLGGRKSAKEVRRSSAVSYFEKIHGVTGVRDVVKKDYMSPEVDEPADPEEKKKWRRYAGAYVRSSQKAVEVQRLRWRSIQLSRLYYALDRLAFDPPQNSGLKATKVKNTRFHGSAANDIHDGPPARTPEYLASPAWLNKPNNDDRAIMSTEAAPSWWNELKIDDDELDSMDSHAIRSWAQDKDSGNEGDDEGANEGGN